MASDAFDGVNGNRIITDELPIDIATPALENAEPIVRKVIVSNLRGQGVAAENLQQLIKGGPEVVPPPFTLMGSIKAAKLFVDAVDALAPDSKLAIWGDYDVDGNTASTVLGTLARQMRPDHTELIEHYIPRREEGFGLNIPGIDKLADKGVTTLFVVDSGTVANKEIAHAQLRGMRVVVIDHHEPGAGQTLPEGAIIINPHQKGEHLSPLKDMSAAGLSWLFAKDVKQVLADRGQGPRANAIDDGLMTVAASLGTISDVVSLQSPINRNIIDEGLKEMETGRYPGIEAMKGLFGLKSIREDDVGFKIGPCINASGRLDDPTVGMRMLLEKDPIKAEQLAKELQAYNDERKQFSNQIIFPEALQKSREFLKQHPDAPVLLLDDAQWMKGVVGIIASRIKERYDLPALTGVGWKSEDGQEYITYSGRSIEGVNLHDLMETAFAKLPKGDVPKFGGHYMAVGLTIKAEAKNRLTEALFSVMGGPVEKARALHAIHIAAEMKPEELTLDTVRQFYQYGVFGARIHPPQILIKNVQVKQMRPLGDSEDHLSISLGGNGSTMPYDALKYGTAFFARATKMEALLRDGNRHNQEFDAVIEPHIIVKNNGESAVGFRLIDASPARVVGHDPDPQMVLDAHLARMAYKREKQRQRIALIESLPLKINELLAGKTPESQAMLKQMFDAKISTIDTETTGLNAGHPDGEKTQGLTQVAVGKVAKVENDGKVHYRYEEKVFPILPVTPAYADYRQQLKNVKKYKIPAPTYDKHRYEYLISREALDVTATEFIRDRHEGPIKEMQVGGKKTEAKPFYESAGEMAAFLGDTTPYAYNMKFDARVIMKHLGDVMSAREQQSASLQLDIRDPDARNAYRKTTESLAHILGTRDHPSPEPPFIKALSHPLHYGCVMLASLLHKGEPAFARQDDMAPLTGVAFIRDPNAHDAAEDIRALPPMLNEQLKFFAKQDADRLTSPEMVERFPALREKIENELRNEGYTMRSLFEKLARGEDPAAKTERGKTLVVKAKETSEVDHLKLIFPSMRSHPEQMPGIQEYFTSLLPAQARNAHIPKLVLGGQNDSVSLDAHPRASGDIPIDASFKKAMCIDRLYASGLVARVKAFDSTSVVDITLKAKNGELPVTVENVPMSGLRKSLDFLLLNKEARPHFQEYLELLRWINDLPQAGLATFDEEGITVRGLQRKFGQLRIALPFGASLHDAVPEIKRRTRDLLSLCTVPGAREAEYNIDDDEDESLHSKQPLKDVVFASEYRLDAPGSIIMDVSGSLLTLVAREMNYKLEGDHFTWPGGIVGQKAQTGDHYLLNGTLENFGEIGQELRNAAWLLYRLKELPGVHKQKTQLSNDGMLSLTCDGPVPLETLWILHRAHVPFKATHDTIEIRLPELMHDAFHWYWEIRKDQDHVKNQMDRKTPDEKPPLFLEALLARMQDGTATDMEMDRDGKIFATVGNYSLVPVNLDATKEAITGAHSQEPLGNPLFKPPGHDVIPHRALAVRLSQLQGVQKNYSQLGRLHDGKCTLTTPSIDPLSNHPKSNGEKTDRRLLIDSFTEMSRVARSAHINPLLDGLRDIISLPDMALEHSEPSGPESPQTLRRFAALSDRITALKPHLEAIKRDVAQFSYEKIELPDTKTKKDKTKLYIETHEDAEAKQQSGKKRQREAHLKEIIFRNVAELALMEKILERAHDAGELTTLSEEEYAHMRNVLKGYYDSVSMAEFKRYRLENDGQQLIKSIERVEKAEKGLQKKIESNGLYGPYLAHKELSSALEKLWEDGKRYKRTLHFSEEIIACSASLQDSRKLAEVGKATEIAYRHQHLEIAQMLGKIKAEGGISSYREDGDRWIFDSGELEKKPQFWDARIHELQNGKQAIPDVPHMIIDTSSLLTLLLGNETFPGDKQAGYLGLIQDLAKHKVIAPVITGAVLAEFLNSPVPLTPQDIFVLNAQGNAVGVKYTDENRRHLRFRQGGKSEVEYPKWHQRLEFLMDLYNNDKGVFIETSTESLYYDAIRGNEKLKSCFAKIARVYPETLAAVSDKTELEKLTNAELKTFLLHPTEARQQFMHQMRSAAVRKDIGEVSLADALQRIHDRFGMQAPVFVLYEGNDVRSRMLMRKVRAAGNTQDSYMAGREKSALLPAAFKPGHAKFEPSHAEALGNTRFLSTLGFLSGLMKSAKEHDVFIVSPDEHNHGIPHNINEPPPDSYPGVGKRLLHNAGKALNGYGRAYSKHVDEPACELGQNRLHSKSFLGGAAGPWQQQLHDADPLALRDVFSNHLIRARHFQQDMLSHHGICSEESVRTILLIEKRLSHLARAKTEEKKPPMPEAAALGSMMLTGPADRRATGMARAILDEHTTMMRALGDSRKMAIRPRLPAGIRLEMQAIPVAQRSSVVEEVSKIISRALSGSAESNIYVREYQELLAKLTEPAQGRQAQR